MLAWIYSNSIGSVSLRHSSHTFHCFPCHLLAKLHGYIPFVIHNPFGHIQYKSEQLLQSEWVWAYGVLGMNTSIMLIQWFNLVSNISKEILYKYTSVRRQFSMHIYIFEHSKSHRKHFRPVPLWRRGEGVSMRKHFRILDDFEHAHFDIRSPFNSDNWYQQTFFYSDTAEWIMHSNFSIIAVCSVRLQRLAMNQASIWICKQTKNLKNMHGEVCTVEKSMLR